MITVRPLQADDRKRWNLLWQGFLDATDTVLADNITQTTWQRLIDPEEQPHGLAALDEDNQVIGIAHYLFHRSTWAAGLYCYLEDLYVDPHVRRSGAARTLIHGVVAAARAKDCDEMYLVTAHDNDAARALYDQVMEQTPFIEYRTELT